MIRQILVRSYLYGKEGNNRIVNVLGVEEVLNFRDRTDTERPGSRRTVSDHGGSKHTGGEQGWVEEWLVILATTFMMTDGCPTRLKPQWSLLLDVECAFEKTP